MKRIFLLLCILITGCAPGAPYFPIVDGAMTTSVIAKSGPEIVHGITVHVQLEHAYVGDLTIVLTHGDQFVVLLDRPGCGAPNLDATFSDDAETKATDVCDPDPGISGVVLPKEALSAFDNQPFAGEWALSVMDGATADEGRIIDWDVELVQTP